MKSQHMITIKNHMNIIWTRLYNIHPGHFLKTFPYHMVHHRKRSSSGTWFPRFMYRQEASAIVYCQSVWCLIIIHDAALSGPLGFASDVIFLLFCKRSSSAAASLDTAALSKNRNHSNVFFIYYIENNTS